MCKHSKTPFSNKIKNRCEPSAVLGFFFTDHREKTYAFLLNFSRHCRGFSEVVRGLFRSNAMILIQVISGFDDVWCTQSELAFICFSHFRFGVRKPINLWLVFRGHFNITSVCYCAWFLFALFAHANECWRTERNERKISFKLAINIRVSFGPMTTN